MAAMQQCAKSIKEHAVSHGNVWWSVEDFYRGNLAHAAQLLEYLLHWPTDEAALQLLRQHVQVRDDSVACSFEGSMVSSACSRLAEALQPAGTQLTVPAQLALVTLLLGNLRGQHQGVPHLAAGLSRLLHEMRAPLLHRPVLSSALSAESRAWVDRRVPLDRRADFDAWLARVAQTPAAWHAIASREVVPNPGGRVVHKMLSKSGASGFKTPFLQCAVQLHCGYTEDQAVLSETGLHFYESVKSADMGTVPASNVLVEALVLGPYVCQHGQCVGQALWYSDAQVDSQDA